jgi:hypothetical protein
MLNKEHMEKLLGEEEDTNDHVNMVKPYKYF